MGVHSKAFFLLDTSVESRANMSDDDSLGSAGDDDVQVAAQISSMLKPLTKKQSKMGKRLSALEGVVAKMAAQLDEQLPQLRRAVEASTGNMVLKSTALLIR